MPRISRQVFAGVPHHVTQRGNKREDVFFRNSDRVTYLDWLGEYCNRYGVAVLAYCLMSNHVHLVVVPETADALERVFRPLHMRYAQRINRSKQWSGHVWQGRFFSAALDELYLFAAVRYVERNPVRAGMVAAAEDYSWSSAAAHCGLRADRLLSPVGPWLPDLDRGADWSGWLAGDEEPGQLKVLRQNVERGFPCGDEAFVSGLESVAGKRLRPASRGRPAAGAAGKGVASPFPA